MPTKFGLNSFRQAQTKIIMSLSWKHCMYIVSSNYRNSIQGRHEKISCRKLIVGEQLAVLSVKMAVISHKIVDTWRSMAV